MTSLQVKTPARFSKVFPQYFLCIYAVTAGFSRAGVHLAIALLAIVFIALRGFKQPIDPTLGKAFAAMFAVFAVTSFFSPNVQVSLTVLGLCVYRVLPFAYAYSFTKSKKDIDNLLIILAVSVLFGSLIAIWQGTHVQFDPANPSGSRAKSFLGIMDFAGTLGVLIPILLVKSFGDNYNHYYRAVFIVSLITSCVALLFNGTRAVWLAVFVSFLVYMLLEGFKNKKIFVWLMVLMLGLGTIVANNPLAWDRLVLISDTTFVSNTKRVEMWQQGWEAFCEYPVAGSGLGCIPPKGFNKMTPQEYDDTPRYHNHVHNNFLQILAETGIGGFVTFTALFGVILSKAWSRINAEQHREFALIALLSTLNFLLHGLFDYTFIMATVMYIYWFVIGLCYREFTFTDT